MHPLQEMKQNRIDAYLTIDQGNVDFMKKMTLEALVAATDVFYGRNQFGDMHIGEIIKWNLAIALRQSEKTRHGNLRHYGFIDLIKAFPRCTLENDFPNGSNAVFLTRDGVPTFVHVKSSPVWGDLALRKQSIRDAAEWLDHYGHIDGVIVFASENGNGDSRSRAVPTFSGRHMVLDLYGTACMEYFTGNPYPLELIERQVMDALDEERIVCPHHQNSILINRKTMELQAELLRNNCELHGIKLINEDGCPIWHNWIQAKELIGKKQKRSAITTNNKAA